MKQVEEITYVPNPWKRLSENWNDRIFDLLHREESFGFIPIVEMAEYSIISRSPIL